MSDPDLDKIEAFHFFESLDKGQGWGSNSEVKLEEDGG